MATPAAAAGAYASIAKNLGKDFGKAGASGDKAPANFASMLGQVLDTTTQTGVDADQKAMQAVTSGKTDIVDVVTAVADSEAAISTLVGVRDRVIAAYQQIMSMPI